ncbi:uncharacterized protein LOC122667910 [Telopea speciosissima]|uniref:uncharacterized protein LOC122667910 n=1 Tax=Telopea speciosissima TaxID=54955 RepID=UPI001CC60BB4|nr:uncharacterized protein LOC122667910 [Telopea speciosissima]
MNSECELDRKSDIAADLPRYGVEHPDVIRVSGATPGEHCYAARIDGTECLTMTAAGSEDSRVLPENVGGEMDAKPVARFPDGREVEDLNSNGTHVVSLAEHVETEKVRCEEVSVLMDVDSESRVSVFRTDDLPSSRESPALAVQDTGTEHATTSLEVMIPGSSSGVTRRDVEATFKRAGSDFDSLYSKLDENAVHELPEALGAETASALKYGFKIGDMVWGKVKSHPWWPGHIFSVAFASPSVRRTKREGHVLVAFFGDSSYGWFDPAELIPFDPHYAEKSRQINSRNFLKAVEEAVDEASRRRALGLACLCWNPFNFRPANVQEYFSVDVGGYEPGGVYSVKQIEMARDSFHPAEMLSLVLQMALTPRSDEHKGIDRIKDNATILAYRKAVFEEYDETYAQAFGVQTTRSRDSMGVLYQPEKIPSRAPLSGPLVIAEALGERKSSTKPIKVKDQSKKDKYLLKRREGPNDLKSHHISQGPVGTSVPSSSKEGVAASAAGDFVLQKRESMKPHTQRKVGAGMISGVISAPSQGAAEQEGIQAADKKPVVAPKSSVDSPVNTSQVTELTGSQLQAAQEVQEHGKQPLDEDMSGLEEVKGRVSVDVVGGPVHLSNTGGMSEHHGAVHHDFWQGGEAMVDVKREEQLKVGNTVEVIEQAKMRITKPSEDHNGLDQVWQGASGIPLVAADVKHPAIKIINTGSDTGMKAKNIRKRPGEELNFEKSIMGERKKKRKKEPGSKASLDYKPKHLKSGRDGESRRKSAGKSIGIGMGSQRKVDGANDTFPSSSVVAPLVVDMENADVDLPQLVDDLLSLALDPFHGVEQNSPAIVRQVFLRFRSIVYQKSLVLLPSTEADTSEQGNKSAAGTGALDIPLGDEGNQPSDSRPPKQLFRSEDPTKAGRKRRPSDRQEEISAKRLKKLKDLKAVTEKKAGNLNISDLQRDRKDVKDGGVVVRAKPMKPVSVKKLEPPLRGVAEPTMLVIKFPPNTTLPSIPALKARFARFGSLDYSAIRVLWKSSTCRVVFMHKSHAHAAYNHAVKNSSLFGSVKVKYFLRDLEVPAQESFDSVRWREDTGDEPLQFRVPSMTNSAGEPRQAAFLPRLPQPSVQLKSCLKKPNGDESGPTVGVPRESPRVKFMLGGEESSKGEQLVVSSSINNNGSNADGGASSLAMGVNTNRKNFQKVVSPLPPLLRFPPCSILDAHESRTVAQLPKYHHLHDSKVETRNNLHNFVTTTTTTITISATNIDISHQMLSLLMRCSDIVTDAKSSLGYVPYHPL